MANLPAISIDSFGNRGAASLGLPPLTNSPGTDGETWCDAVDGYPFPRDRAVKVQVAREAARLSFVLARLEVTLTEADICGQFVERQHGRTIQLTIKPRSP